VDREESDRLPLREVRYKRNEILLVVYAQQSMVTTSYRDVNYSGFLLDLKSLLKEIGMKVHCLDVKTRLVIYAFNE
jgi:hypothetical protein